jgi:hypothetical protein
MGRNGWEFDPEETTSRRPFLLKVSMIVLPAENPVAD